ncbi:MAG: acyltransferase [Chloroflexaceae bacterium]|nr:acyltransferase [Chloroflexaceae bacterium]
MDVITSAPPSPSHETRATLPYLPGLDGLRAIAVIAVVLFHAGLPIWGGFLGVESFFVMSGFLITALLLIEWQQQQTIHLKQFWLRRARRLLPALILVLIGVTVMGHIGGFGGFRSAVWYAPASGISVSLAVNQFATNPNILATSAFDAALTAQGQ